MGIRASRRAKAFGAIPAVNFTETDKAYEITSELPGGMGEKNVEVNFANGVLTIKGEKQEEREEKKKGYHMRERSLGSFELRCPRASMPTRSRRISKRVGL